MTNPIIETAAKHIDQLESLYADPTELRGIALTTMLTDNDGNNILDDLSPEDQELLNHFKVKNLSTFDLEGEEQKILRNDAPSEGLVVHYNVSPNLYIPLIVGQWANPNEYDSETLAGSHIRSEAITRQELPPMMVRKLHYLSIIGFVDDSGEYSLIRNNGSLGTKGFDLTENMLRALGNIYTNIAAEYDIHAGDRLSSAKMNQAGAIFIELNDPEFIAKLTEKPAAEITDTLDM